MDFTLSPEQQMLQDTTRRFIAERCDFTARRARLAAGHSRVLWTQLGDLGLLGLNIPEADGGLGAGPVDTMLVASAIGAGLLVEPFLASAVLATHAIVQLGCAAQRAQWLPAMAAGDLVAVLAHDEPDSVPGARALMTTATQTREGWELTGAKALVYHAPWAQLLLVSARAGTELGVFAIAADAPGVRLASSISVDDQAVAQVILEQARVPRAARLGGEAAAALGAVQDLGLAGLCAEGFGAMERLLAATIAYSRARVQFGQPLATFQALRHRLVDMQVHLEQARSMLYLATCRCTDPDPEARRAALSAAKALMGQAARYIGQQAVQLHGGIGLADELDVSHYFRRLVAFELRGGTTDQHLHAYRRALTAA